MNCWNPHGGDTSAKTVYRGYALCEECLGVAFDWPEDIADTQLFERYLIFSRDSDWEDKYSHEVVAYILAEHRGELEG